MKIHGDWRKGYTYFGSLVQIGTVQNVPQDIHWGIWLDRNTGLHACLVDILDQFAGAGTARGGLVGGIGGGNGGHGSLVVEAVKIAASLLEVGHPFVRLSNWVSANCRFHT